uniref:(California timema) hypothetical protein n=1 Tax=Timema californicum TaxID=61474 RepID=A0A7R9JGK2_TIMCA|nr:unnamed protein product [Timema californicum]
MRPVSILAFRHLLKLSQDKLDFIDCCTYRFLHPFDSSFQNGKLLLRHFRSSLGMSGRLRVKLATFDVGQHLPGLDFPHHLVRVDVVLGEEHLDLHIFLVSTSPTTWSGSMSYLAKNISISSSEKLHFLRVSLISLNLRPEQEVRQLSEGAKHDEEHDREPCDVPGTSRQCITQLGHRLVETDKLEDLHPGKEQRYRLHVVVIYLQSTQVIEIGESCLLFEEALQHVAKLYELENVEYYASIGEGDYYEVEHIPKTSDVLKLEVYYLTDFFQSEEYYEAYEQNLASEYEIIERSLSVRKSQVGMAPPVGGNSTRNLGRIHLLRKFLANPSSLTCPMFPASYRRTREIVVARGEGSTEFIVDRARVISNFNLPHPRDSQHSVLVQNISVFFRRDSLVVVPHVPEEAVNQWAFNSDTIKSLVHSWGTRRWSEYGPIESLVHSWGTRPWSEYGTIKSLVHSWGTRPWPEYGPIKSLVHSWGTGPWPEFDPIKSLVHSWGTRPWSEFGLEYVMLIIPRATMLNTIRKRTYMMSSFSDSWISKVLSSVPSAICLVTQRFSKRCRHPV